MASGSENSRLIASLNGMSESERAVFRMIYLHDLDSQQAASRLGIPENEVRKVNRDLLRRLRGQ